jgi:hypothetical protein
VGKFLDGSYFEDRKPDIIIAVGLNLETYGMMMGGYKSFNN